MAPHSSTLLSLVILLITIHHIECVEPDFPNFKVEQLGGDVTLLCNSTTVPEGSEPIFWVSPQRQAVSPNTTQGNRHFSEDATEVRITGVTMQDIGYWHCGLKTINETTYMQRIGLNANGPYFEDLWAKYQQNTIIGVSVGAGFVVLAVVLCMVNQFQWEKRMADKTQEYDFKNEQPAINGYGDDSYGSKVNGSSANVLSGHSNEAYDPEVKVASLAENGDSAVVRF